ncbi:hypothetical protein RSAG8_07517, partial [Rhizoctonia solani AG-8 WAC10335]
MMMVLRLKCRWLYTISNQDMSVARATRCLLTLSKKPDLAHLVHSFSFNTSLSPYFLQAFLILLSRALSNMNNLRVLSLELDVPIIISPLDRVFCRLTKFTCILTLEGSFPLSQFLLNQPTIEELYIICQSDDLSALEPGALPALKDLTAPLQLLPKLLAYRLPCLSRLCVLDTLYNWTNFLLLAAVLVISLPPESIELAIRVEIDPTVTGTAGILFGLGRLGRACPYITSLRLDTYGDFLGQEELHNMFAPALSNFPNLEKSMITSQSATSDEYIRNSAQIQPALTPSGVDPSFHSVLEFASDTLSDFISDVLPALSAPPVP